MLVFNKTPTVRRKFNISLPVSKAVRRANTLNIKRQIKITKENKRFLRDIGLKLK